MPSLHEELKKLSTQETNKKRWTKEVDTFTRRHKWLTGTCGEGESMSLTLNNANQNHNGMSSPLPNLHPCPGQNGYYQKDKRQKHWQRCGGTRTHCW